MRQEIVDFTYPLLADVYYPITETGGYGNIRKQWVLDRTISAAFNPAGRKYQQDMNTEANLNIDNAILGRTRNDLTQSDRDSLYSITNIIITNIRDIDGNIIYNESAGPRVGKATIFELATINPIVGPFGKTEYFKLVLRRSENQAVDL